MGRRRKYDTEALVDRMKAERRTGIMLALAGVFVLFFIVGLYAIGSNDDDEIPEVDKRAAAAANAAQQIDGANEQTEVDADKQDEPHAVPEPGGDPDAVAGGAGDATPADIPPDHVEPDTDLEKTVETPVEDVPPGPVLVTVSLTRKGVLFIDNKKVGKTKKKTVKLAPGPHRFRAKFGRKMVKGVLEIEAGGPVAVRVDHKRKKVTLGK